MSRVPLLRAAFGLALLVIFVLAMIPVAVVPEVMSNQDKLHHSAAFGTLMLLGRGGWPTRLGLVALGLLGYGILIELCQHAFTANRVGELRDVIADGLGIALGWLLARGWRMAPA